MAMMSGVLGIDTSCYTTSVAFVSGGRVVAHRRRILAVKQGERGLRQSEAVFQHVRRLPELLEDLFLELAPDDAIEAVCVSARPRDAEDSYMPVFAAGEAFARSIAATLRVPVYKTTHQQGHVRAALMDAEIDTREPFLALHLSGGTTETLLVQKGLRISRVGGTDDLNAGQLVDRAGVRLGLTFPCGAQLEALARNGAAKGILPLSSKGVLCSFSGAETKLARLIDAEALAPADAAREVYSFLSRAVAKLIAEAVVKTHVTQALLAGGVASSQLLREELPKRLMRLKCETRVAWARPELSGDNAVGVALIGEDLLQEGR